MWLCEVSVSPVYQVPSDHLEGTGMARAESACTEKGAGEKQYYHVSTFPSLPLLFLCLSIVSPDL